MSYNPINIVLGDSIFDIDATIILIVLILKDWESKALLRTVIQLFTTEWIKYLFYFYPVWSLIANPLKRRTSLEICLLRIIDIMSLILNMTRQSSWD